MWIVPTLMHFTAVVYCGEVRFAQWGSCVDPTGADMASQQP